MTAPHCVDPPPQTLFSNAIREGEGFELQSVMVDGSRLWGEYGQGQGREGKGSELLQGSDWSETAAAESGKEACGSRVVAHAIPLLLNLPLRNYVWLIDQNTDQTPGELK